MNYLRLIPLFFVITVLQSVSAQSTISKLPFPQEGSWVNDSEGLFTPEQRNELNSILSDFEKRTNNEIAVITVKSYLPYNNLLELSTDLSNNWGLGRSNDKNSLIILVSKTLGQVRISTSYGTERLLRNEICKRIINNDMLPSYGTGKYFFGTKQGVLSLMKEWN